MDKVFGSPVPDTKTLKSRIKDDLLAVTKKKKMVENTWQETEHQ